MPTPLSFGLVGAGWIGAFHADTLARRLPNARLTAVADPQPGAAERLSAQFAHFVDCVHAGDRALGDRRRRARRPRDRPCRARVGGDRGTRRPEWCAAVSGFQLAVCSEMVFTDLPIIDRVRRIDEMGFAVEIWSWHDKDLKALADTGARFSSMTGYLHGDLIDPTSADEVVRTAELSIKAAETLGVPRLNLHTAELVDGKAARPRYRATGEMWTTALRTLERIGELGAAAGVTFCVENLNTIVDHPGIPLARAKDTLALVEAVGHPNVKMMLDLYHAQIGEGNLIELVRRCGDAIGEIQVADVPGRCEPGTGEINYPAIAKALRDIGFAGTVGMEAWASGDSADGAGSVPKRVPLSSERALTANFAPTLRCSHDGASGRPTWCRSSTATRGSSGCRTRPRCRSRRTRFAPSSATARWVSRRAAGPPNGSRRARRCVGVPAECAHRAPAATDTARCSPALSASGAISAGRWLVITASGSPLAQRSR